MHLQQVAQTQSRLSIVSPSRETESEDKRKKEREDTLSYLEINKDKIRNTYLQK